MPSHSARRVVIAAVLAALVIPIAAGAQDATVSSAIIPVANSPASIEGCRVVKATDYRNSWNAVVTVGNHTKHSLIAVDMQFVGYDSENSKASQVGLHFSGFDPIATRDTGVIRANLLFDLAAIANNPSLLAKVSCRVIGAQFTGNTKWALGTAWPEPILSIEAATMIPSGGGQGDGAAAVRASTTQKVTVQVTNSWNDTVQNILFVHDALSITGGSADVTLRGSDLLLTMTITGNIKRQYIGLSQAAPTYQKLNPLGSQTSTAYEVQPESDLGRLGSITVPAHATVTTTVTFAVPDPVITSTDNRTVTVR